MGQALIKNRTCIVFPPSFTAIFQSVHQQHQLAFPIINAERLHAQYLCVCCFFMCHIIANSWQSTEQSTLIETHKKILKLLNFTRPQSNCTGKRRLGGGGVAGKQSWWDDNLTKTEGNYADQTKWGIMWHRWPQIRQWRGQNQKEKRPVKMIDFQNKIGSNYKKWKLAEISRNTEGTDRGKIRIISETTNN